MKHATWSRMIASVFLLCGTACGTARGTAPNPGLASQMTLQTLDGSAMNAELSLPEGNGPFPVALLLPGGRGAAEIGKVWPHHHRFAAALGQRGIATLVLDYHNGNRVLVDLGVAIDVLKRNPKLRPDRMVLVGFSMGGANALRVAGSRSDIAGLVMLFSPAELGTEAPGARQPIDFVGSVSCPALILQGDRDEITPAEQARKLSQAFTEHGKRAQLIVYPGGGHGFTYVGAPVGRCCNYDAAITASALESVAEFVRQP
jgi:dienelactone hydrolase